MRMRLLIFTGVLLIFSGRPGQVAAEDSATANQDQSIINEQQISSGNQSITFPTSTPLRGFPLPGSNPLPPTLAIPSHFAPPVTDGNYGSLITLLAYKSVYTMADAKALLEDDGDIRVRTTCYVPDNQRQVSERLKILPEPKEKEVFNRNYEVIGIGNYKSMDTDTTSEQVLGIAIREGLIIGADVLLFQEGAALVQVAQGYSIGLSNSFSVSNNPYYHTGLGNVTVGGIGFGKGKTGYSSKPWLRVQFFRARSPQGDPLHNGSKGLTPKNEKGDDFERTLQETKEPTPDEKMKGTYGGSR